MAPWMKKGSAVYPATGVKLCLAVAADSKSTPDRTRWNPMPSREQWSRLVVRSVVGMKVVGTAAGSSALYLHAFPPQCLFFGER